MFSRRSFALGIVVALATLPGCAKKTDGIRCARCGMRVTDGSSFKVEGTVEGGQARIYDSPLCAFNAKVDPKAKEKVLSLRFQDFYERKVYDGAELRFVGGSDVKGPMGPDLIPVLPAMEAKFTKDHGKRGVFSYAEITQAVLNDLE
jgi:hypothetical protein